MIQAVGIVRTPLDNFYNSLSEEQRQRFAALGPASDARTNRRGSASGNDLAALCSRRTERFTQLPVERIEQVVKPTQEQRDAFARSKDRVNGGCQSIAGILPYPDATITDGSI